MICIACGSNEHRDIHKCPMLKSPFERENAQLRALVEEGISIAERSTGIVHELWSEKEIEQWLTKAKNLRGKS